MKKIFKSKTSKIVLGALVVAIVGLTPFGLKVYDNYKEEQFLIKAETYIQKEADNFNKKTVNGDKIEVRREGNIITYSQNYSLDMTVTEMYEDGRKSGITALEYFGDYADNIRQTIVDTASYYYDEIVKLYGDEYEFTIRSEKSQNDELYLIATYNQEEGYKFEYDLFEELGY